MCSAGVSVWAPTGILSFYPAASAPRHHRQLRWLNPTSAEIAEPFPRLWRGDCPADWGQTIAGCPGRLRAAHSSHSAQIPKPSQWEVNQLLTVFHKQFSSCFLNYKTIRFFFCIIISHQSLQASCKDPKVNLSVHLQTQLCYLSMSLLWVNTQEQALLFSTVWNFQTENW